MDKTKIDWADASWNPVTGCLHGCEYCYARRIATRFSGFLPEENPGTWGFRRGGTIVELDEMQARTQKDGKVVPGIYPFGFTPTFHRYRLDEPARWTKPRNIFVCSMADLFGDWVPDEWISEVLSACTKAPQHNYMFLTKNPKRYFALTKSMGLPAWSNFWYGTTATTPETEFFAAADAKIFLSIEPIAASFGTLEECSHDYQGFDHVNWVIVGAETGTRAGKIVPERKWIEDLTEVCASKNIPLFMKSSLEQMMGDDFKQEYPAGLIRRNRESR